MDLDTKRVLNHLSIEFQKMKKFRAIKFNFITTIKFLNSYLVIQKITLLVIFTLNSKLIKSKIVPIKTNFGVSNYQLLLLEKIFMFPWKVNKLLLMNPLFSLIQLLNIFGSKKYIIVFNLLIYLYLNYNYNIWIINKNLILFNYRKN